MKNLDYNCMQFKFNWPLYVFSWTFFLSPCQADRIQKGQIVAGILFAFAHRKLPFGMRVRPKTRTQTMEMRTSLSPQSQTRCECYRVGFKINMYVYAQRLDEGRKGGREGHKCLWCHTKLFANTEHALKSCHKEE